jgi:hypothetical protein
MRKMLLAAAIAVVAIPAVPMMAVAQDRHDNRDNGRDNGRHDDRGRHDGRHDNGNHNAGNGNRNWQTYRNYDYNRHEAGQQTYYADRYYRDGRYYQPRRLGRNDRIYRGSDNRYYCRRSDGTTGLIIGGLGGAVLGNSIAGGGSRTLGTLLGGAAGALLGQSIDRGNVTCR